MPSLTQLSQSASVTPTSLPQPMRSSLLHAGAFNAFFWLFSEELGVIGKRCLLARSRRATESVCRKRRRVIAEVLIQERERVNHHRDVARVNLFGQHFAVGCLELLAVRTLKVLPQVDLDWSVAERHTAALLGDERG